MLSNKNYSTSECAKILGVSRITVFNWIKTGKISAQKHAGNYLVPKTELDKMREKKELSEEDKKGLREFVGRLIRDYSELLIHLE